jgi:hypothetical protein
MLLVKTTIRVTDAVDPGVEGLRSVLLVPVPVRFAQPVPIAPSTWILSTGTAGQPRQVLLVLPRLVSHKLREAGLEAANLVAVVE